MEDTSVYAVKAGSSINTRLYTSIDHIYVCVDWFSMLKVFSFVAMVKKSVKALKL